MDRSRGLFVRKMSLKKEENGSMRLRWPIGDVVAFAKRYALTHGLVCLVPDNLDQATIVPFSLFPSPYSYLHFKFIWSIQTTYNRLYNLVSLDDDALEKILSPVISIDEYIARLWKIHRTCKRRQPIQLDIYRSKQVVYRLKIFVELDYLNKIECLCHLVLTLNVKTQCPTVFV